MKVKQGLIGLMSPTTPQELRLKAARLLEPSAALPPEDQVTVLFVLSHDKTSDEVSEAAKKSLAGYPPEQLLAALDKKLDPLVVKKIVELHNDNEAILIMAALNPGTDGQTLQKLAETGPEELVALIAEDKEMLLENPSLAGAIRKNPAASPSVIRVLEAALGAKGGAAGEKKQDRSLPVNKELLEEKKVDEQNIYKLVQNMSMAQKVKLALTGNKSSRELLIKDTNKMISVAVLKNPRITEDEVMRLTNSRSTPEDLLRQVARNKEWTKNYNIKMGMVTNPKTPLTISLKMLDHLYEKDLASLAKSKNVASVLSSTARRKLETKKK